MSDKGSKKSNHYYAGLGMVFGSGSGSGSGIDLVFGQAILADVAHGLIAGAGIGLVFGSAIGHRKSGSE